MENQEHDTLESIIRAAREMSLRRNPVPARRSELMSKKDKEDTVAQAGETAHAENAVNMAEAPSTEDTIKAQAADDTGNGSITGYAEKPKMILETGTEESPEKEPEITYEEEPSEDLLTAARAFSETLQSSGVHFLEFSVAFLAMFRRHYQLETNDIRANSLAFFALIALDSWANEAYTMSELADKLQVPKQQLTKLINDLEERKLVERTHDTTNRRRVYIRICEPGRCLMEDVKQKMLQATLHGLRSYSKEELLEMDQCICRLTELMERFNTDPE